MSAATQPSRKRVPSRAGFQPSAVSRRRTARKALLGLLAPQDAPAGDDQDRSWAIHRGAFPGDRAG